MTLTIVGTQLGDEGKGGIVDVFGETADVVVRYQGGDNAGHTVVDGEEEYKLSLVPSGAVRGKIGVLGNGCVVNPRTLFEEIDALRERDLDPDVRIARRAHVILPYHRVLDGVEESAKSDDDLEAGTTGRGIGPTYEDKAGRRGIRVGDLLDPDVLRERLEYVVPRKRALMSEVFDVDPDTVEPAGAFDLEALFETCSDYGERLARESMTVNAGDFVVKRIDRGDNVVFEGAQGTGIDIDHGIYPYVTSSNPTAGGAAVGTGVGPGVVGAGDIVGVVKAYLSRVGTGPLPTELEGDLAEYIREEGGEYGTVTGRPRRVGWLDLPMLRHATRASSLTGIALNHLDVLAGLDRVKVATAYECDGERLGTMPCTTEQWGRCDPRYETFEGWPEADWTSVAEEGFDALPANAQRYATFVAEDLDVPILALGIGPGREQTIIRSHPFE
jgi:adenylosuccinate synthase